MCVVIRIHVQIVHKLIKKGEKLFSSITWQFARNLELIHDFTVKIEFINLVKSFIVLNPSQITQPAAYHRIAIIISCLVVNFFK